MDKLNDLSYVAYDGYETHLSDNLYEIFEKIINNLKHDKVKSCYVWYLPAASLYDGFCSTGCTDFGPVNKTGHGIGIPLYLGDDLHNIRIVQKHMEVAFDKVQTVGWN